MIVLGISESITDLARSVGPNKITHDGGWRMLEKAFVIFLRIQSQIQ